MIALEPLSVIDIIVLLHTLLYYIGGSPTFSLITYHRNSANQAKATSYDAIIGF